MQEPGRRPAPPFAGVDLRRPKGYPAPAGKAEELGSAAQTTVAATAPPAGDPCPRCESRDTKFCYYNNYNTSQPRHFCRSCRRYWTKGGSLRNVPVGGGTRKGSSAPSSPPPAAAKNPKRYSKRRRVAPAPDPATPSTDAAPTADVAQNTAPTPAAPSTAKGATAAEEPAAPTAANGGGFTDTSASLGPGLAEGGGKEPTDASQFEWPSGCDLGSSYWGTGVFADADPALFLNLP